MTLYAAGTSGYATGATSLGSTTSAGDGSFAVSYNCPSGNPQTYLVATGGNAGSGTNTAIGLMALIGPCGSIQNTTTVNINELTTVAGVWALAQFSDAGGVMIGAPATNLTGLHNGYLSAYNLVAVDQSDFSVSGNPSSFWSDEGATEATCTGASPPVNCDGLERLNTLADILAACINSSGPASTACSTLFMDTGVSTSGSTLAIAHAIATNPVTNVGGIFDVLTAPATAPFQPTLASAPDGWEIALNLAPSGANFNQPIGVAIDAGGNVWVTNFNNSSVTELTSSGGLAGNFAPSGANFSAPRGVAVDAGGNVWVTNASGNSVTELTSSGGLVGNFAPTGANFNEPIGVAIDAGGNVWVTNLDGNSVTELTSSGGLAGNFAPSGANFNGPSSVAIDAGGNVWVTNADGESVTELTSSGSLAGNFAPSGANFNGPFSVAIDAGGNVWVTNEGGNSVTELTSSGGLVGNFAPTGVNFHGPFGVAIDAAGNVWVTNEGGNSVAELVGAARPVLTPLVACLKQSPPHAVCLP